MCRTFRNVENSNVNDNNYLFGIIKANGNTFFPGPMTTEPSKKINHSVNGTSINTVSYVIAHVHKIIQTISLFILEDDLFKIKVSLFVTVD